ncbi:MULTISPECIES: sigma-70 family RNA polymerase sigma factor [unclassified Herbaspirillum]|uniref:sigma-70 family RNA polymerase sigma factor n=1 Tax=unclassified Herbaspirillum TaxID=2624150 RepID=UPI000E2EF387|nr:MULTISPECIES: sigma-70 family RNA polymerase sigma factor [unclassified Herbaspirillum]RFB69760.1 sigma-70 family RNA polymerase sigma factor [Herbaspirillum sp. 3R-3a1]TFI07179.1 sigma-70 family RNA polymerase sigma factor [Herbaspirillum sp. 3R11]TFI13116.1 sigma-70 family RNA polymerase sigma factor [Herbaspirillum sp. 3R-11]TFI25756.1 sigma-70 family RNA polymerase sigma factor [Herbaspirillum sp. 3C11]
MSDKSFEQAVVAERSMLVRFARLHLQEDTAEDAAQETLLAALQNPAGYSGKSSLRTWLVGILKHKIVDVLRKEKKYVQAGPAEIGDPGDFDVLFDDTGHWAEAPADWGNPAETLQQAQFFDIMDFCLNKLTPVMARVFSMRELFEFEITEICKELKITAGNCSVLLYRARMQLRLCLDQNWFESRKA